MSPEADKGLLAEMFRAYASMMGYSLLVEKLDDVGAFGLGRVRVELTDKFGRPDVGLLCDCLVQSGGEDDMVCSMLERAFGDGEPMIHHFDKIGLGEIRSMPELALKLAVMAR